mmetsp:Transcript_20647/g.45108  ORF Transcript_20647/g.45108 Transcript_20647/m.45108 type:complete len:231 (+) Transcript_20647:183-875(+)|eukprot:CAMPEP_0178507788 /NCGR_PEP_ID=MMETSP0696-20121128/20404_1 /TAXON_ID=265572 /ORGANISM="Extubocellulus spinifer, Strain CCMP396" /LENGTH=230 /DNA_ID=CAMNT_0020137295 /DNA_START=102 /DNA_END=794 /DNA_ORIENTATION=+
MPKSRTVGDLLRSLKIGDRESSQNLPSDSASSSTLGKIVKYLEKEDWKFNVSNGSERSLVHMGVGARNGTFNVVISVNEEDKLVLVYVIAPIKVPEGIKRINVADFITRANFGVVIGNFEMDFADGELRYKSSVQFKGSVLSDQMIEDLIGKSVCTIDHYFPGLMKVIYSDTSASEAISEIEPSQSGGQQPSPVQASAVQVLERTSGVGDEGEHGTSQEALVIIPEATSE